MAGEIANKVAQSGLKIFDLEAFYPDGKRMSLDIKPWLDKGAVLREKAFRQQLKAHDWVTYRDAYVAVYNSAAALIPAWAYMLVTTFLQPHAKRVVQGDLEALEGALFYAALHDLDISPYRGARVIIKGCAHKPIPQAAFVTLIQKLLPVSQSIMYGEACSTVPLFKRKKSP
ncbi:MAG: DUF2480 family protein [Flavobacteriales bacterium]